MTNHEINQLFGWLAPFHWLVDAPDVIVEYWLVVSEFANYLTKLTEIVDQIKPRRQHLCGILI